VIDIRPRESVILARDFAATVDWYRRALGFRVVKQFDDGFNYCNLETSSGIRLGIGDAQQMGVTDDTLNNDTVIIQFEVDDVGKFFAHVEQLGGSITGGPSFDPSGEFWFGSFADPEGNEFWVVDKNCP
jgi:predicted enzyme related to lactoylglutathione lyase